MTYLQQERSQERGAPIELYEFQYGPEPQHAYRYNNSVRDLSGPGGHTFLRMPIGRDTVKTNGKLEKTNLNVRVPVNSDLSNLFLPYPPPQVVRFTMWARHQTDTDHQDYVIWRGKVLSSAREKTEAVLTCDNTILSMKRQGLRRLYQHGCPYLLYGNRCGADKALFSKAVEIAEINPDGSIQFPADWFLPYAAINYRGGTIEWTTPIGKEYRTIIDTGDGWVKIGGILRNIEAGDSVTVALGCNHDMKSCRDIFDNINNYGGQPWIPTKNPVKQHPFW